MGKASKEEYIKAVLIFLNKNALGFRWNDQT